MQQYFEYFSTKPFIFKFKIQSNKFQNILLSSCPSSMSMQPRKLFIEYFDKLDVCNFKNSSKLLGIHALVSTGWIMTTVLISSALVITYT